MQKKRDLSRSFTQKAQSEEHTLYTEVSDSGAETASTTTATAKKQINDN